MASKIIKCFHGAVEVGDDYGLHLAADDGENRARVVLNPEDARKIAKALDAFAEIHSQE